MKIHLKLLDQWVKKMASKARLVSKAFRTNNDGTVQLKSGFGDSAEPIVIPVEIVSDNTIVLADSAEAVIDTFDGSLIRAAHYHMICNTPADSDHQAQQIFVTHNGTTATLVTYGTLLHGTDTIVTYDASIDSSSTVSLLADPQAIDGLKFSFKRIDVETSE